MKSIKRILLMLISMSIIVGVSSLSFANNYEPTLMENVKVYIEGIDFENNQDFYSFNGTTLVPMRELFEKLGAEVRWEQKTKTIFVKRDKTSIELVIDNKTAKINGKNVTLTIEPKLINQVTYVPLRFVAEAFDYEVDWNGKNRIISIVDLEQIKQQKYSKIYETSSFFKDDYVKMEIIDNKEINVKGGTKLDKREFRVHIRDDGQFRRYGNGDIKSNKTYQETVSLKDLEEEKNYEIAIFFDSDEDGEGVYRSYYNKIPFKYENGEIFFPISQVFENNYFQYMKNSVINPKNYLDILIKSDFEKNEIKNLANEITKNSKSDYEKVLKINEWVAENIYYNFDGYNSGTYGKTDAYGTLKAKKSVCQGYAELTDALLKSAGVPSRLVTGHALGISASGKGWDSVDHTRSNHAWNEAFVDNRWVILDTTWNSNNRYENGVFEKRTMKYKYFDPKLETFSDTHKIMTYR